MEEDKSQFKEEIEELKASIAELGFSVEETSEGEIRVSTKEEN
ncbi:MAG: hypothetical protein ACOYS2_01695 [Patescibacteria group bacterium]